MESKKEDINNNPLNIKVRIQITVRPEGLLNGVGSRGCSFS
jgi:hypothetical protein